MSVTWLEDKAADVPAWEVLRDLYDHYASEGHLATMGFLGDDTPDGRWLAWCIGCKINCWGTTAAELLSLGQAVETGDDLARARPQTLTYEEAKAWAHGHREEHGLARQEWMPRIDVSREAGNGHWTDRSHIPGGEAGGVL